ncbi:SRPBCC family protein [Streptomyces millisiae]|uniref:ATPase n=1 Tax=Streptomyces millisiae TaxID=3075542 RepID=A0ABU2LRP0_9ACTN|nr:hypothetical protein [Streptomyces sp. DSM 44918]MDT0320221.1 hypothetical protein [Streptomyces sp. DSM 44918]
MPPAPTGRLVLTPTGHDLVLTRTYRAPAVDVWASVTEPERTARWFGPWRGTTELRLATTSPPGWEYYLDMLTAAHTGEPRPDFADYYPAQQAYFESLA